MADYPGTAEAIMFLGTIEAVRPASGVFDEQTVEIEVHDWMGIAATQELGLRPTEVDEYFDDAVGQAISIAPIQPEVDFDQGETLFPSIFDTDSRLTSLMSFIAKACRNEQGRCWVSKNGVLMLENHVARWNRTDLLFTLDGSMVELETGWEPDSIINHVAANVYPATPVSGTVKIGEINGAPPIAAGETLEVVVYFTDPDTGKPVAAYNVEDPVDGSDIEFGSTQNFVNDDMAANLAQNNEVGAVSMLCRLTNTHATDTGYLNGFDIQGERLIRGDGLVADVKDQTSIDAHGERRLNLTLEHVNSPEEAQDFGTYILNQAAELHPKVDRIGFVAVGYDLIAAALELDISDRFRVLETQTGLDSYRFVNGLAYTFRAGHLYCELLGSSEEQS